MLTKELYGEYECKAENALGEIRKKIELAEGVKADPPSSVAVHSTGAHSARIDIRPPVNDPQLAIGYRVQFVRTDQDGNYSWDHPEYQDVYTSQSSSLPMYLF